MSRRGEGNGGVYFSTKGPANYEIGTPEYEFNIIKDLFGKLYLKKDFLGKQKVDVCLVFGVNPLLLEKATFGGDNSVVVSKELFDAIAPADSVGDYFLRSDFLLGAFWVDSSGTSFLNNVDDEINDDDVAGSGNSLTSQNRLDRAAKLSSVLLSQDDGLFREKLELEKVRNVKNHYSLECCAKASVLLFWQLLFNFFLFCIFVVVSNDYIYYFTPINSIFVLCCILLLLTI
jgi:hypothetical protein